MERKTCPHCGESLPIERFYATHGWCKECLNAAVRERRKNGPPYRRPKRDSSPEERERLRGYARAHYHRLPADRKAEYIRKASEGRHERMFGGLREATIRRDGERCQNCGMARQEHIARFGRDLHVHHINGRGRRSEKPDNRMENLTTLCHPCHSSLHRRARKAK